MGSGGYSMVELQQISVCKLNLPKLGKFLVARSWFQINSFKKLTSWPAPPSRHAGGGAVS